MEPVSAPGERVFYSDLNFLLLTEILEAALGAPLDRLFEELVARPARSGARFLPDAWRFPRRISLRRFPRRPRRATASSA